MASTFFCFYPNRLLFTGQFDEHNLQNESHMEGELKRNEEILWYFLGKNLLGEFQLISDSVFVYKHFIFSTYCVWWFYCHYGVVLDLHWENLLALVGELCSFSRLPRGDSWVPVYHWTHGRLSAMKTGFKYMILSFYELLSVFTDKGSGPFPFHLKKQIQQTFDTIRWTGYWPIVRPVPT
jgi:hypothetical protein